jgi:putative sigma-54 modulation protein
VHVILSVEKLRQKAEVTVHVRGKDIFVEAQDDTDLYASIDALADKLDRQVLKHKEKKSEHNHEALKRQQPKKAREFRNASPRRGLSRYNARDSSQERPG